MCQFCGIFGGFFAVVEPILHERCLSQVVPLCLVPEIALPRACRADDFGWFGHGVHFLRFFPHFLFFFRGGSNMVAFRAKVDGTWQAKFQRRLRYRVAGLRPSGLPNLPFSLSLPFPPSSSNSFPFPNVFSNFPLFTLFPPPFLFFFPFFFPQFTSNFPSLPSISRFFPAFFGQSDASPCDPLSAMCTTRHGILKRTRHVLKEDFCIFFGIFGHIQKRGSYW